MGLCPNVLIPSTLHKPLSFSPTPLVFSQLRDNFLTFILFFKIVFVFLCA